MKQKLGRGKKKNMNGRKGEKFLRWGEMEGGVVVEERRSNVLLLSLLRDKRGDVGLGASPRCPLPLSSLPTSVAAHNRNRNNFTEPRLEIVFLGCQRRLSNFFSLGKVTKS